MLARGMVRKGRASLGRFAVLLALALSCARTELTFECTPGEARFCDANGRVGAQTCSSLGYWGTCEAHESRGSGSGSSGGTGSHTGGSGVSSGSGGIVNAAGDGGIIDVGEGGADSEAGEGGAGSESGAGGVPSEGGAGGEGEGEPQVLFERYLGEGDFFASDVSVNAQGEVALALSGSGTIDFGGLTEPFDTSQSGSYLARFDNDGVAHWATTLAGTPFHGPERIALDDAGVLFGGGRFDIISGFVQSFAVPSANTPTCELSMSHGHVSSIVATGDGGFVAGGTLYGIVDLGGGPMGPGPDERTGFVAAFDGQCQWLWGRTFSNSGPWVAPPGAAAVAVDDTGMVIVAGTTGGRVDFGEGPLGTPSQLNIYLAKFTGAGVFSSARLFSDDGNLRVGAVAVDADDHIFMSGAHDSPFDFGSGEVPETSPFEESTFLAKFDADGEPLWAMALDASTDWNLDVALDPSGNVIVGGAFWPTPTSPADGFVQKFDPAGGSIWRKNFGGKLLQFVTGIAIDPGGNVFVAGALGDLDRAYFAKLAP
jgi:hypothetical protein